MKRYFLPIFTTLIFLSGHCQIDRFSQEKYEGTAGILQYRLLTPDANPTRKLPLVVFLHGSGERGDDNASQLKWGVQQFASDDNMKRFPAYVVAPQCPAAAQWASYDGVFKEEPTPSMKLVREMIDELMDRYPIDERRIYITGLSMGGYGTFDALARYPELFAAAVPVCGAGDPSTVNRFKDIPIWIYTGAEDQAVRPEWTLKMFDALMKTGSKPGYTQVPEVGHFSWIAAYSDEMVLEWLFRQRKD